MPFPSIPPHPLPLFLELRPSSHHVTTEKDRAFGQSASPLPLQARLLWARAGPLGEQERSSLDESLLWKLPGVGQGPLLVCPVLTLIYLSTQIPTLQDLDPGGFLPHQPVCPNVHKCFENVVLVVGTVSSEQSVSPNPGAVPESSTRGVDGHGGVGLGESPGAPKSPQAQPGNALLQGIATSFLVGNKTRNLGQDGNTRAFHTTTTSLQTTLRFPGIRLPWHEDLRFSSTQAFALLTLRLPGGLLKARPFGMATLSPTLRSPRRPRPLAQTRGSPKGLAHHPPPSEGRGPPERACRGSPGTSRLIRCPCHTQPSPGALEEAVTGTPQSRPPERREGTLAPPSSPSHAPPFALTSRGQTLLVHPWRWTGVGARDAFRTRPFLDPENPGGSRRESSSQAGSS